MMSCAYLPLFQLLSAVDWLYTCFIHISSLGDGFVPAPGADLIEPEVDKQAELIKYKLFDLNIMEADIHVMEDSTVTRLQVGTLCCYRVWGFGAVIPMPLEILTRCNNV